MVGLCVAVLLPLMLFIWALENKELELKGHKIIRPEQPIGGAQVILDDKSSNTLIGGSDPRKDGYAIGY